MSLLERGYRIARRMVSCAAFCIILILSLCAQEPNQQQWYIEPAIRIGRIIPNASNTAWLSHVSLYSAELRLGKQTTGQHEWERLLITPNTGFACATAISTTTSSVIK